jgi:hypothetical protein
MSERRLEAEARRFRLAANKPTLVFMLYAAAA